MTPSGVSQEQEFDSLNPTDNYNEIWQLNSAYLGIMTESTNDLRYRDDIESMTGDIQNNAPGTLDFVNGSYHAFGNNGTAAEGGSIINFSLNTSLNDIVGNGWLTPSQVLGSMNNTVGNDHLPVVADFTISVPEPGALVLIGVATLFLRRRVRRV